MAFNVRIFGYRGISQVKLLHPRQYSADAVFLLDEPFVWSQLLVADAVAVYSEARTGGDNDRVTIARVEVPNAAAIRYRILPVNYPDNPADTLCPILTGSDQFIFSPGYRISIIDAAALP